MSRKLLLVASLCLVTLTTGCCGFRRCCSPCGNPCGNACGVGGGYSPYGGYPAYGPTSYVDPYGMAAVSSEPMMETAAMDAPVYQGAMLPQPMTATPIAAAPVAPVAPNYGGAPVYGGIQQAGYAEYAAPNTAVFKPASLPTYE